MRARAFRYLVAGALVVAGAVGMSSASAVGAIDQSNDVAPAADNGYYIQAVETVAQTFTAGQTGSLDQVDLKFGTTGSGPYHIHVDIRDNSGGDPFGGPVLASGEVDSASITKVYGDGTEPAWSAVALSPPAASVVGGKYAIVLSSPDTTGAYWQFSTSTTDYAGGGSSYVFFGSTSPGIADMRFRTHVDSPVDSDSDTYFSDVDCNDADATIHPGATDVPDDGIDQNCSGSDAVTYYVDGDGDIYGAGSGTVVDGPAPSGSVANHTDCDDANAAIHPGATDVPDDGIDQNCSGSDAVTYYADGDSDTYGNAASSQVVDGPAPAGYVSNSTDCDDTRSGVHPGATEVHQNGLDDDCNSSTVDNTAPTATAQAVSTNEDTNKLVTLTGTDVDTDTLSFRITTLPTHGTLFQGATAITSVPTTLSGNTVTYKPALNYNGPDSFGFKSYDGAALSPEATVAVTVNTVDDATATKYIGPTSVKIGATFLPKAQLSSSDPSCTGSQPIYFSLNKNPITGAGGTYALTGSFTTNTSGQTQSGNTVTTTGWKAGTYTITAKFLGSGLGSGTGCLLSQGSSALNIKK